MRIPSHMHYFYFNYTLMLILVYNENLQHCLKCTKFTHNLYAFNIDNFFYYEGFCRCSLLICKLLFISCIYVTQCTEIQGLLVPYFMLKTAVITLRNKFRLCRHSL